MISFSEKDNKIILSYSPRFAEDGWVLTRLKEEGEITIKRTFTLKNEHLLNSYNSWDDFMDETNDEEEETSPDHFHFLFATRNGEYFKIEEDILISNQNVYIYQDIPLSSKMFIASTNISIFGAIQKLTSEDIYVGGDFETAIPLNAFEQLVASFPNTYEIKKYAHSRISIILREYLENAKDAETGYKKYMNKKVSKKGKDLKKLFKETELFKYQTILDKLSGMLKSEVQYSENQWQEEILQIILLLYPKYLYVFKEVQINDPTIGSRFLDYMVIDANGHADIIEIKQPFDKCIITENKYRNNYIPLRELSGTIMQIEKYIYFLNRWGATGEKELSKRYNAELPEGFGIKITNPSGIIIMGRDNALRQDQKLDFEVVKRKYKNMIDIITYDNLTYRLKATIEQLSKL